MAREEHNIKQSKICYSGSDGNAVSQHITTKSCLCHQLIAWDEGHVNKNEDKPGEGSTCHQSTGLEMKSMAGSVFERGMSRTDMSLLQRLAASNGDEKCSTDALGSSRKSPMRLPPLSGRRAACNLGAPSCEKDLQAF